MPDPKDPNAPDNPAPADAEEPLATAEDLEKIVETTAKQKEEEQRRTDEEAEKKKKAELQALRRPVTISEQETKRLVEKFRAAAQQELSEYVIFSFPAKLLEDGVGPSTTPIPSGRRRSWVRPGDTTMLGKNI